VGGGWLFIVSWVLMGLCEIFLYFFRFFCFFGGGAIFFIQRSLISVGVFHPRVGMKVCFALFIHT